MNIAVVGLGFMGSTHLQALQNVPEASLAAVISADEKKLAGDLSSIHGNLDRPGAKLDFSAAKKYRKLEEALADPAIDAIDLCLPTHLHAPAAIAALEAGKHVLVEKPMALSGEECDAMIAAAKKANRLLMVAQVLRFWNSYQPLIDGVRKGELGPMRSSLFRRRCAAPAWGQWLQDPEKGGGGVFDLLIHDVDLCVHLFGVPRAVSATGYEDLGAGLDLVTATLHYDGAGAVVVTGGWHHPKSYPFSMEYTASFQGGTLEFSSAGKAATLHNAAGEAVECAVPARDGFEAELEYFVHCAATGRTPERCDPAESAAAVRLTRLMAEARKSPGRILECRF